MSTNTNLQEFLQEIAEAIRSKCGKTDLICAQNFASEIELMEPLYESKDIYNNGEHDVKDYKTVNVAVPGTEEYESFLAGTLERVIIPESITVVRSLFSSYEYGVKPILMLHNGVTNIGNQQPSGTLKIHYSGTIDQWNTITYMGLAQNAGFGWELYLLNSSTGEYNLVEEVSITSSVQSKSYYSYHMKMNIGVKKVIYEEGVTKIDGCQSAKNIEEVVIPSTATTIVGYAFSDCPSLTYLEIPETLTDISGYNCLYIGSSTNKATIIMNHTTPPTCGSGTFNTSYLDKIFVPLGTRETYIAATNWSRYADYIYEPNNVTFTVPSEILNNENYGYSLDNGETWNNFETTYFVVDRVRTVKFKNLVSDVVLLIGTTEGGSDIGTIANAELMYTTSGNVSIYITIQ